MKENIMHTISFDSYDNKFKKDSAPPVLGDQGTKMNYLLTEMVDGTDMLDVLLNTFNGPNYVQADWNAAAKLNSWLTGGDEAKNSLILDIDQRMGAIEDIKGWDNNPDLKAEYNALLLAKKGLLNLSEIRQTELPLLYKQIYAIRDHLRIAHTNSIEFASSMVSGTSGILGKEYKEFMDKTSLDTNPGRKTTALQYGVRVSVDDSYKHILLRPSLTGNGEYDFLEYTKVFAVQFSALLDTGNLSHLQKGVEKRIDEIQKGGDYKNSMIGKAELDNLSKIRDTLKTIDPKNPPKGPALELMINDLVTPFNDLSEAYAVLNSNAVVNQAAVTGFLQKMDPKYDPHKEWDISYADLETLILSIMGERSELTTAYVNMMYKAIQENNAFIRARNAEVKFISDYKNQSLSAADKAHVTNMRRFASGFNEAMAQQIVDGTYTGPIKVSEDDKKSAQFMLDHRAVFSLLDTAKSGGKNDGIITTDDFDAFLTKAPSDEQKPKADAEMKSVQVRIEEINNDQQLAIMKLQKGSTTVTECADTMTTIMNKFHQMRSGIIKNIG